MMENTRAISDIKIGNRARKDMGDIAGLAASIADVGLLHPVVISKTGELIAGERRIRAFELLGKTKIPVTVADLAEIVRGEHAENEQRKDFTLTEAVAIKRAVEPLMAAEAKVRMVGGKGADGSGGRGKKAKPGANLAQGKGKTRDNVAKHTGKKASSLAKAEKVIDAAEAEPEKFAPLVEEMDRTGKVDGAYKQLKTLKASPVDTAKADRAEAKSVASKASDVMPDATADDSAMKAKADRAEQAAAAKQAALKPKLTVEPTAAAKPKPGDNPAATGVKLIDLIEHLGRINVGVTVARMSNDDRITLMTQIVQAHAWLNKTAVEVAISGGANLGKLAPVGLRFEALDFLKAASARIETELAARPVAVPGIVE
jgi:ParB-like nuclease domain